jgi:hypothetical protein
MFDFQFQIKKRSLKNRNWKIYDSNIPIGKKRLAKKLGIRKSMIFKVFQIGKHEEVIIF